MTHLLAGHTDPIEIRPLLDGAPYTGATFSVRVSIVGGALVGTYACPETGASTGIYRAASDFDTTGHNGRSLLFQAVESSPVAREWPGAEVVEVSRGVSASLTAASAPIATAAGVSAVGTAVAGVQSHGDTAWATAASFATSGALATAQADLTAIKGAGFTAGADDLHAARAAVATAAGVTSAASAINAHTDAAVTGLATGANVTTSQGVITAAISAAQSAILAAVPSAAVVAAAVAGLDISALTNAKTLGGAITRLRKWLTWTSATTNVKKFVGNVFRVYDDDGTTVLDNAPLTAVGGTVAPATGEVNQVG